MFAPFIQYLIRSGISEYTIIMLLFLPLVTALITITRYIIGWRTINIYTTILLAYALFDLGYIHKGLTDYSSALFYGSLFIVATSLVGIMVHSWLHDVRLHYLSKVSIVMSFSTIGTLFLLYVSTYIDQVSLNMVNPLTILLFIVSVEALVKSYVRHGVKKAIRLMIFTIILASALFILMSQEILQNALIDYPEIAGLMIVTSFLVGKWRGLKLLEYFRFRNILSQDSHDPEDLSE
jgi:hypothetical protein